MYMGIKRNIKLNPTLACYIAKRILLYSNISKKCLLCLHEKLKRINYPRPEELRNKRSELSVVMLINFYCAIIKQSIDCSHLIAKQHWTRFYVVIMFIVMSIICLKIVKYMKLKVAKKLPWFFSLILYYCLCILIYPSSTLFIIQYKLNIRCSLLFYFVGHSHCYVNMEKINFNYSLGNFPTPTKTSYQLTLMEKIGNIIKQMRWKTHFYLN